MTTGKPNAVSADSKALHYTTRVLVSLVAIGAAVLSFDALTALATASGIRPEFAWIWALVIDFFILVATLAAFMLRERTGFTRYYVWLTLGLFVVFSILGNAWHAAIVEENYVLPLWVRVAVTAVPPLALFLAIHLLILMISPTPEQKVEFKRQREHADRLNRLRERELEKLEKQAVVEEVRDRSKLHINQEPKPQPVTPSPNPPVKPPAPQVEPDGEIKTEEEVKTILNQMVLDGVELPSGRTVAEWLGKSERTGQNFMKAYKQSLDVAE